MKRGHEPQTAVAVDLHMNWKHNRAERRLYIENLGSVVVDSWA